MRDQLHWAELPTAALTRWTVAMHRSDSREPLELVDFCFWPPADQQQARPPAEAGAAMLELIRRQQFPRFALVAYDALAAAGKDQAAPRRLALLAGDAVLLAPRPTPQGWQGFLIAEDTAADQPRAFHWPEDPEAVQWLHVPPPVEPGAAVWAVADASLPTLQSPDSSGSPPAPPA